MPPRTKQPPAAPGRKALMGVYRRLLRRFGPQAWWPGESPFEVCVGAILVQNTSWTNAARAIANLKAGGLLSPRGLRGVPLARLARLVRPARFFNMKARRLKGFVDFLWEEFGGDPGRLFRLPREELRRRLLGVNGVGPETADSIILYAAGKPAFVVDAYTRRIFERLGLHRPSKNGSAGYQELQALFVKNLPEDVPLWNEYHALLVRLGNTHCRPRPSCGECPLGRICDFPARGEG